METIGQRVRAEREARGDSRAKLATAAGISATALSDLELGYSQSSLSLHRIAAALGVRTTWLETGKGPKTQTAQPEGEWKDVIGYVQDVGAGAGTEAQEYAETHALKFKATSLRRKGLLNNRLAVYYAKGDSMEPRIRTGDAILFDQDDTTPVHNGIYVVRWRGEEYVKRAKVVEDLVLFESDNPFGDHTWGRPKRMDSAREPIEVIGRVRWIGSWED
ncbi:helix-turn-helix transcriptional regulator [Xanthomonas sp. XNM01]|nr:S24 family peptidase [Xanthomonas sp. XNM01]MBD9368835.1 helix-turn-helix transcriptional regulator [Xanthomonas sp. XNM01]